MGNRIYTIDVANIPPGVQDEYIKRVMEKFKKPPLTKKIIENNIKSLKSNLEGNIKKGYATDKHLKTIIRNIRIQNKLLRELEDKKDIPIKHHDYTFEYKDISKLKQDEKEIAYKNIMETFENQLEKWVYKN